MGMRRKKNYTNNNGRLRPCNHGDIRICVVCQYNFDCPFSEGGSDRDMALWKRKQQEVNGSQRWLWGGQITKPYLWIDTYNQCVNEVAGTIKARIDSNCMYFVSIPIEDESIRTRQKQKQWAFGKDNKPTSEPIHQLHTHECRGGGWKTMEVLVVIVYETEDTTSHQARLHIDWAWRSVWCSLSE